MCTYCPHTNAPKHYIQVAVNNRKPYLDEEGSVHWPVLLMYPETMGQDVVEDWHEDEPVAAHLDVVSRLVCSMQYEVL